MHYYLIIVYLLNVHYVIRELYLLTTVLVIDIYHVATLIVKSSMVVYSPTIDVMQSQIMYHHSHFHFHSACHPSGEVVLLHD